ncbi:hypothetical protein ACMFMF_011115 [Clarireedia jacksonii]
MQMFSNAGQDQAEKVIESARPYVAEGVKVPWFLSAKEDEDGDEEDHANMNTKKPSESERIHGT